MEKTTTTKQWTDRVLEHLDPEIPGVEPRPLAEFTRRLLARATGELVERRHPRTLAREVESLFAFLQETPPAEVGVRVEEVKERPHRLVVETVMPDCPFIVNTLREYAHAEDFHVVHLLHPVLVVERDEDGSVVGLREREADESLTSVVYMVLDGHVDPGQAEEMEREIRRRLGLVRVATDDFEPMLERCRTVIDDLEAQKERTPWRATELAEIQEFLSWLIDGAFVFLGYRGYDLWTDDDGRRWIQVEEGSGLGILTDESDSRYAEPHPLDELAADLKARVLGGPLLIVSKTNAKSPVHRRARMDYLGVKKLSPEGEILGERRFLGLFTARAYAQDASTVPILRRKLREILEAEGATRGSHDYNEILRIFNTMPTEELFLASVPELLNVIDAVRATEGADDVRVLPRPDPLARGVNVLVILPRHRFSEEVRRQVERDLLEAYRGEVLNYHLSMNGGDQARLHFYLDTRLSELEQVDVGELEERVREAVRSWEERLSDALEKRHGVEEAHQLSDRHRAEFSTEYKATVDVQTAVEDIRRLESLDATGMQQLSLEAADPDRPEASILKVFTPRGLYVLSDLMPMLENLGLRVLEADKYDVGEEGAAPRTIHTFEVETAREWRLDRAEAEPRMAETLRAIRRRSAEDDPLNSLVLSAGLTWRQVALLRAYAGYAFRIGAVASRAGVREPLVFFPELARQLFRIFEALHDPERDGGRRARANELIEQFHDGLDRVRSIEHDRTYRRLLALMDATARTNFYQARARERPQGMIALKFDCRRLEILPSPRPRYEIYVNSGRTEGAHLRMGKVARGGIRWSDRVEDFRVEVLGLVKTQQVKNAVIVPAGAKGAFLVKDPPADAGEAREAAKESYGEFIRGLLDVTDNIVDGEVVAPRETVVRDEEDPYLVVAADKGTAHLPDTANEVAGEYDFWLGDAFASGGARGYDHKELGITARGAWECVKRHFRERGTDLQVEEITVVGIGDMSGDVFGNGMLLSRKIRLVAAFDHRHVFLDPQPDPEAGYEERRRLFEMERSSWDDYDREVLSDGGGIWERGEKEIRLPERARRMLDLEEETVNGETLIRAILRADVDLLWNGGIGTYVKASDETHGQVGDPGNDDVRVDAGELGADVVGEGGNLGFTQRARVEYAMGGGRINTDALDNSGGVDMSDHEVNLKILLDSAVRRGRLEAEDRDGLLREITDRVVESVLGDSYGQSLAVSLDEIRARDVPGAFRDLLTWLERAGVLDRALEALPGPEELLERQEEGLFLTRPELAVLLAHAKMHLKREVLDSDLPEDPALEPLFHGYFPERAVEAAGPEALEGHRLRRHIVATRLTNLLVNRMGSASHVEMMRETGKTASEVVKAWYCAYRVGQARELYRRLEELDGRVPAAVQNRWFLELGQGLERTARWILTAVPADATIQETVDRYEGPVEKLRGALSELLSAGRLEEWESRKIRHETDGMPGRMAEEFATFEHLDGLMPVAEMARVHGMDATRVGHVHFGVAGDIDFRWLHTALERAAGAGLWEQRAAKALALQLEAARTRISRNVLATVEEAGGVEEALEAFRRRHARELERIRQVLEDVRAAETPNLAALTVAVHAIHNQPLAREPDAAS